MATYFILNPNERPEKQTYVFKSLRAAPKIKELQKFEDALFDLVKSISFRKYSNAFQRKLKRMKILNETKVIVPANKSSNSYKLTKDDYVKLMK